MAPACYHGHERAAESPGPSRREAVGPRERLRQTLEHDWTADPFPGVCPYHGDCLEGLASAHALAQRWGERPEVLSVDHPAWALEAQYLALGVVGVIAVLSPRRIVIGGGLSRQSALLPLVRANVLRLLNGYVPSAAIGERIDDYLVTSALGPRAGVLGALALAQNVVRVRSGGPSGGRA